jgi:hypothetical protein
MVELKIEKEYENDDSLVFCYPDIDKKDIPQLLFASMDNDTALHPHISAIEDFMMEDGFEFSSPGGSFMRKLIVLMICLLNSTERRRHRLYKDLLRHAEIRRNMHPIAMRVLNTHSSSNIQRS